MDLNAGLHLKLQQKLVMTPMLQQALKVLQLNTLELSDLIQQECNDNPMLEEAGSGSAEGPGEGEAKNEGAAEVSEGEPVEISPSPREETTPEIKFDQPGATPGENLDDYFDDNGTDYGPGQEGEEPEKETFDKYLTRPPSLQEHLLAQLQSLDLPGPQREAATELIGAVDERGYLAATLEDVAMRLNIPLQDARQALEAVQDFDPTGIAARDLKECLLLQLRARDLQGSLAWDLVEKHLQDLERRRPEQLAVEIGKAPGEIEEAIKIIRTLEPVPGRPFGWEPNPDVTVDAVVYKDEEGDYKVQVMDSNLPRLSINRYYRQMLKAAGGERDATRAYLNEKYQAAVWLIKSIEQRRRTLQRVLECIVEHQKGFLDEGPEAFRPLTLREVAVQAGLHESTISRVTTNKYAQTPRGIFPLKYFFSGGLKTEGGEDASTMAIKEKLKALLESEDPHAPHSDQKLAELLAGQGIKIARRTVAKYREEIKSPPAHLRKKT